MKESKFWQEKKKLEESLLKEISEEGKEFKDFFKRYKLEDTVYSSLGVIGGAYVLCDKSMNEMLYLQNRDLQRLMLQEHKNLPILEIPYKYNHIKRTKSEEVESSDKKELVDAIFIGTLDHIKIQQPNNGLPKIYKHLPNNLSSEEFDKLLPFEKDFVKKGYKAIYCTVGEILFYLYLWRLLFRITQEKGLGNRNTSQYVQKYTYDRKLKQNYSLWELEIEEKDIPEVDWIKSIETRYEIKADSSKSDNERLAAQKVIKQWENIIRTIDIASFEEFDILEEYKYLGLVSIDASSLEREDVISNRELLSLVQYLIHISKVYFKSETFDGGQEQEYILPNIPENFGYSIDEINERQVLYNLYFLEYRLNALIQLGPQGEKDYFDLQHLNSKYRFDECLQFFAKKFLFEHILKTEEKEVELLSAIKAIHSKSRFPILPYYYELALGDKHEPKEHFVLSIWNTSDDDVKIPFKFPPSSKNSKEKSEAAVAFIALTLRPNWRIDGINKYSFTKNDQSIHWAKELSEKTFIRLLRIQSFFTSYSRPLIDRLFYGEFIKKQLKKTSTSTDINAFSHELSKIVDNIFDLSSISFQKLFADNKHNKIIRAIQEFANEKDYPLGFDEIKRWKLIPNFKRFHVWSNYLQMWSGRTNKAVFGVSLKESLKEIIDNCNELAKDMFVGETMGRFHKAENLNLLHEYAKRFEDKKRELKDKELILTENAEIIKGWLLSSENTNNLSNKLEFKDDSIIKPNAFLRIMVATLTNIYEHSSGDFFLDVRVKDDLKGNSSLRFCFVNPCEIRDNNLRNKESFGTKPVINSCLALLDGSFECFGYPKQGRQEEVWRERTGLHSKEYDLWLTKFLIPIGGTFLN